MAATGRSDRPRRRATKRDPLAPYKRVRKPMPPPERVIPDKRREAEEELVRKEAEEERR